MLPLLYFLLATQGVSARMGEARQDIPSKNVSVERTDDGNGNRLNEAIGVSVERTDDGNGNRLNEAIGVSVEAIAQIKVPPPKDCCSEDCVTVPHGTVVFTEPEGCAQLQCIDGVLTIVFVNSPTDKGCCEFGGHLYPDGSELPGLCLKFICQDGQWVLREGIDDCCVPCYLYNDPHIMTFDKQRYDWHGTCNYSVTQSDLTFTPDVGVFSDFRPCGAASCLDCTTFRDNPHTIISFCTKDPVYQVKVNGVGVNIPAIGIIQLQTVLAFRSDSCAVFVGSSGLVVRHCKSRLDILAHPVHFDHLDGLCGHYNQYRPDDFTSRSGVELPLQKYPVLFPLSWKTNVQAERRCFGRCPETHVCDDTGAVPLTDGTTSPCKAKGKGIRGKIAEAAVTLQYSAYLRRCTADLKEIIGAVEDFKFLLENCADDLCVYTEAGATKDDCIEIRKDIIHLNCERRQMEDALNGDRIFAWNCAKYAAGVIHKTNTTHITLPPPIMGEKDGF